MTVVRPRELDARETHGLAVVETVEHQGLRVLRAIPCSIFSIGERRGEEREVEGRRERERGERVIPEKASPALRFFTLRLRPSIPATGSKSVTDSHIAHVIVPALPAVAFLGLRAYEGAKNRVSWI